MATIGAEVGQKMRSAIKAKLLELNCYVDDELPDYVMVMVANKRTKSQMKEDLQLFLSNKTATFVDWLHIVLKKLKEVTVTNPEVYKKTAKRKSDDVPNTNVKKEKKDKNGDKKQKKNELVEHNTSEETVFKSLTDDLPINANKLSEQRKIIIMKENKTNNAEHQLMQDNFDIPLLSEVNMSTEEELEDLEKKIKSVKSRLGLLVESDDDDDDDDDCIKLKPEPDELIALDAEKSGRKIHIVEAESVSKSPKKPERARITFNSKELEEITTKRKSVLDRLGKRRSNGNEAANSVKRSRTDFREEYKEKRARRRDEDKSKESILNRLGVMSKVSIPVKPQEEPEEPLKNREVPSVVKIKPRVIPHDAPQANKNLLLKAVAEAQRSVTQTPPVGTAKPDALYTKKYKEKLKEDQSGSKKLPECEKNKIKKLVAAGSEDPKSGDKMEYVPTPLNKLQEPKNQARGEEAVENGTMKQKFIVTLDGLQKTKYKDLLAEEPKPSIKSRLDWKKSPSPIIFDVAAPPPAKSHIPDKLPLVHASASVKNKERCKYWPACRQGDKCEFVHPNTNCEKFPNCKFGEKCLFLHPSCKFASSCTRRDCPYSHSPATKSLGKVAGPQVQTCKFFPNCANPNCAFFHPKPCKFGRFCKNQAECSFSHAFAAIKGNMTWRSK